MEQLNELLRNDELLVFGSMTIVGVVFLVAHHWCKLRIAGWEVSLKQSMLEAGMSAEEIRTVLEATSMESGGCRRKAQRLRSEKPNGTTAWRQADPKEVVVR